MTMKLDPETVDALAVSIYEYFAATRKAEISRSAASKPPGFYVFELDLSTAAGVNNPFAIGFPFKSFYILDATDTDTTLSLSVHGRTTQHLQNALPLRKNASVELPEVAAEGFLTWEAQSGKTATIAVSLEGVLRTGILTSQNAGGVSVNTGSAGADVIVTLAAATAAKLFDTNIDRKNGTYQNKTGASIFVGCTNAVTNSGATMGLEVADGEMLEWKNTAPLWAYSVGGGAVVTLEEE